MIQLKFDDILDNRFKSWDKKLNKILQISFNVRFSRVLILTYVVSFVLDEVFWWILVGLIIVLIQIDKIRLDFFFVTENEARRGEHQKAKNQQLHFENNRFRNLGTTLNFFDKDPLLLLRLTRDCEL